jgi:hypothetical protein
MWRVCCRMFGYRYLISDVVSRCRTYDVPTKPTNLKAYQMDLAQSAVGAHSLNICFKFMVPIRS